MNIKFLFLLGILSGFHRFGYAFVPTAPTLAEHRFTLPGCALQQQHTKTVRLHSLIRNDNNRLSLNPDKALMSKAYRRGSYLFAALSLIIFLIPDRTVSTLLASKVGGAAGYAMAGGLCHILAGANEHDRLGSDTYLRLNLGLLGFSALGVLFVPSEAGFLFRKAQSVLLSVVLTMAKVYGALLSFLGWKRGVDPEGTYAIDKMVQEMKDGAIKTVKGLRVDNAKTALTYRNCLLLVVLGIFSNIMEGNFNFRYREALQRSWFEVSLNGSAASRLVMVATMIYSLKDAGERDRLTGTTFVQLNLLLGVWALAVSLGQCVFPYGFAYHRGVEMFSFSLVFLAKALKYQYKKQEAKKEKEKS